MERQIKYWILEFEFSEEKKKALDDISEQYHMTYDEIFKSAVLHLIDHPEEFAIRNKLFPEQEKSEDIKLIRVFPAYEDETDEEARSRAVEAEERETEK